MTHSNSDRLAVITGGSRGIGAGIAEKLAAMGFTAAILGRDLTALNEVAGRIISRGGRCRIEQCDIQSPEQVEQVAAKVGAPEVLVNCAGVGLMGRPLLDCTPRDWELVMNTNLRGVFFVVKAFAPQMVKSGGGHIINISSIAGRNPLPGGAIYSASKWGLNGLSYSLAEELRGSNIRVSVISPGSVNTHFSTHENKNLSRMLTPNDVANAVAMLVTQEPQSFVSEIVLRPTQKP